MALGYRSPKGVFRSPQPDLKLDIRIRILRTRGSGLKLQKQKAYSLVSSL